MTTNPDTGWWERLEARLALIPGPEDGAAPSEDDVLISRLSAALRARVAEIDRLAGLEIENELLIQMHQHMCDLVGHDVSEAYHTGRRTNLKAQTALVVLLEAKTEGQAAALEVAKAGLGNARMKFLSYADSHRAKQTEEALIKARVNEDCAAECFTALATVNAALGGTK